METADNYRQAVECFERNDINSAQKILLDLIEGNSNDFDALHFSGIIKLNLGEYNEAASFFEKAIEVYEPNDTAHYNLALCYQQLNKFDPAINHYKRTVELNPGYFDAFNNLGVIFLNQNEFGRAEKCFNLALSLKPCNSKVFNNMGNLYFKQDKYEPAEKNYRSALSLEPGNPEYNFNLGSCFLQKKEFEEALKYFLRSKELSPNSTLAYNNIGLTLFKLHRYKEAEEYFKIVLNKNPHDAEVRFNLAGCYRELNDFNQAIENFDTAVKIDPNLKGALVNIGNLYKKMGDEKKAEKYFDKVSDVDADKVIAFTNLGVMRMGLGNIEEAIEYFNLALKANPGVPEIHYNKSHALLIKGKLEEGWKEYEWRKKRKEYFPRKYSRPELKHGMAVRGKKILVFDEQGLGDSIQFIRYVPLLLESGAEIILECNKNLIRIFHDNIKNVKLIERDIQNEPQIDYDCQVPLLSLPSFFKTTLANIPDHIPYLRADKNLSKQMSEIIGSRDKFKIGIVWGGNPNHTGDNKRSIKLSYFQKFLNVKNVKLYSLQKGKPLEQIKEYDFPLTVLDELLKDFADTAAVIDNLDLIITIDTSVAHLAGAMGKPVWLLLPFFPDWRWLLDRGDSPWYPTMEIFRQPDEGNWDYVFNEVVSELNKVVLPGDGNNSDAIFSSKSQFNFDNQTMENKKLFLGLSSTGDFGWGVVNKYLKKELSKLIEVRSLENNECPSSSETGNAKVFQLLRDLDFNPLFEFKGNENFGYTVFESELNKNSVINAANFDKVITASSWGRQKLADAGINNSDCLIQGVDTELFYPENIIRNDNLFVVFSGGKFELRKGQDLVLKAISVLQKKYKDIILITAWYNIWFESARLMTLSKHIRYEEKGSSWEEFMNNIYLINGVDLKRVFTLPLVPNQKLRQLYLKSDIGLFPNRCEGGTNLVMMEYMACGRPVVASFNTGHKDVLNEKNSLMLKKMNEFKLYDGEKNLTADWEEPDVDEIISAIEFAYHNRSALKDLGNAASESMKNFLWFNTASNLLKIVGIS